MPTIPRTGVTGEQGIVRLIYLSLQKNERQVDGLETDIVCLQAIYLFLHF